MPNEDFGKKDDKTTTGEKKSISTYIIDSIIAVGKD